MIFNLIHKQTNETIDKIRSTDLKNAIFFFINRKKMSLKVFNSLYEVKEAKEI